MQPQIWNIVALAVLSGINSVRPLPQNSIWEVILGGGLDAFLPPNKTIPQLSFYR